MGSEGLGDAAEGRDARLHQREKKILIGALPPIVAAVAVAMEPALTALSRSREAILPLATLVLLAALLHPRLRHFLVVGLCFGVSFLAVRDIWRVNQVPLPPVLRYDLLETLRPIGLLTVAVLAALAGIGESIRPGAIWARRFYFGSAALYFTGLGLMNYAWHGSWRAVVLFVTGVTALLGCLFAHLLSDPHVQPEANEVDPDTKQQQERETAHRLALQTKEWRDGILSAMEERESAVGGQSVPPRC